MLDHGWKHTCNFQQSVCQSAFSMVNVCNNAKIPDFVDRKLGEVNGFLEKKTTKKQTNVQSFIFLQPQKFIQSNPLYTNILYALQYMYVCISIRNHQEII